MIHIIKRILSNLVLKVAAANNSSKGFKKNQAENI